MRIFEEKQRFNPWWLYAVYALVLCLLIGGAYKNSNGFRNFDNPVIFILLLAGIFLVVFILLLQMETRIDPEGIKVKFPSLPFSEKNFQWIDIKECYVRKYSPLAEYDGWGIRGLLSNNNGIQIVTNDNFRFFIGTQKAEAVKAVLENYEHKINRNINH
jgi:hypothetical protein